MAPSPVARRVMTPATVRATFRLNVKMRVLRACCPPKPEEGIRSVRLFPRPHLSDPGGPSATRARRAHSTPDAFPVYCGRVTLEADRLPERDFDTGGPTLGDVGEAELLRALSEIARAVSAGLTLGSGDDAA